MYSNRNKTLKPIKAQAAPARSQLSTFAQHTLATLGSGSMREAVALPKGEDINEWLAVNTVDFFNELSMLYGTIAEYCTKVTLTLTVKNVVDLIVDAFSVLLVSRPLVL